jgi:hypothetical protein
MRTAARVDANHGEICEAYRAMGFSVANTFQLGKGFPDIAVAKWGMTDLVEIKDGSKTPSKRKLTPDEIEFHNNWHAKVWVIESVNDVIEHAADFRRRWEV